MLYPVDVIAASADRSIIVVLRHLLHVVLCLYKSLGCQLQTNQSTLQSAERIANDLGSLARVFVMPLFLPESQLESFRLV